MTAAVSQKNPRDEHALADDRRRTVEQMVASYCRLKLHYTPNMTEQVSRNIATVFERYPNFRAPL